MTVIPLHRPALDNDDPLSLALHYASLGWRVIPIAPGRKHPEGFGRWQDHATFDEATIRQWWGQRPDWGVGIACGPDSGLFALDVDPGHGGDDTLSTLEHHHAALPDTVEAITGGGGRHLLFRWPVLPEDVELRNSAGRLGPGLDIRADGGQVVVAPTLHPTSGNRYAWELSSRPGEVALAEAPAWLVTLLTETVTPPPEGQVEGAVDSRYAWDSYETLGNAEAIRLLTQQGWHSPRTDRSGVTYMVRPGKAAADGTGCTVGKTRPGLVYCFTGEAPPLEADHGYRLPELLAVLCFGGDRVAADTALAERSGLARTHFGPAERREMTAWLEYQHTLAGIDDAVYSGSAITDADGYDIREAHDFLAEPDPEHSWLIPGLLERGDRMILTAGEGMGKSTLLRQIAVQAAIGHHPFDEGVRFPPAVVVYVDLENSVRHLRRKLRALMPLASHDLARDRLWIVPKPEGIDLATQPDIDWISGVMEVLQPQLLIIGPIYKMSDGDPTEERTAKVVVRALDTLRARHDCAVLIEAHTPSETAGKHRPERPYGASLWRRWPEFGIFLAPDGTLRHWRGARDERDWPAKLERGESARRWPWERSTSKDITFARMMEVQRAAPRKLSYREITAGLEAMGLAKGIGIGKTNVGDAIKANKQAWDEMLDELGFGHD